MVAWRTTATKDETKQVGGENQTNQPDQTLRVLTPPPEKIRKNSELTFSIAGYENLRPADVLFTITVNSETTRTVKNDTYNLEFTYQPSTLWMQMPDGTAFPVLQTPDYTNGLVPTTDVDENGYMPSMGFWKAIVDKSERAKVQKDSRLTINEDQIPIHERYLLYLLLTQVLSPHYETPDVFCFVFGCAYNKRNEEYIG